MKVQTLVCILFFTGFVSTELSAANAALSKECSSAAEKPLVSEVLGLLDALSRQLDEEMNWDRTVGFCRMAGRLHGLGEALSILIGAGGGEGAQAHLNLSSDAASYCQDALLDKITLTPEGKGYIREGIAAYKRYLVRDSSAAASGARKKNSRKKNH